MFRTLSSTIFVVTAILTSSAVLRSQPLNERVLVVYNSNQADSLAVATHYRDTRSIPPANLCGIVPASTTALTQSQFESTVRGPIQACLEARGRRHILYIVLAWGMPYKVTVNSRVFAVDSALADVWDEVAAEFPAYPDPPRNTNPYYADAQTLGNIYPEFVPLSAFRADSASKVVYSVWRLDAATPDLAKALVNRAVQAERSGLAGVACFDRSRGNIDLLADWSYIAGDWDLARAASFARQAGFTTIEDPDTAEFGTAPAPLRCDGAALYAGWYSYNNYPDAFSWNPGAIGFHLDSASALDPRGGTNFTAVAVQKGITITGGAVNEPYLSGLVHPDVFYRSIFAGANVGDAMLRSLPWLKWMVLSVGDPLYRPFPSGRAPFHATRLEDGLQLSRTYVLGGAPVTGTVFLSSPAPSGGAVLSLSNTMKAVVTLPSTVTVPAGQRSASFALSTVRPTEDSAVRIDATYNGVVRRNSVVVVPLLGGITALEGSSTVGGGTRRYRMELNGPAPADGLTVSLSSDNSAVAPPASLRFAPGEESRQFTVGTSAVAANTSVTISATDGRTTRRVILIVLPPALRSVAISPTTVAGPGAATGTVQLTGVAPAGGTAVTLTSSSAAARVPASFLIPAGSATGTFTISVGAVGANTTVTITARAGNVSRTASLTAVAGFSVKLSAARVMGGAQPLLAITLGAPAPAAGATLSLSTSNPVVATVPASVTVPAGTSTISVPVRTNAVSTETTVEIRATLGSQVRSAALSVVPVLIQSSYIPATIKGGTASGGEIYLNAVATTGVTLSTASSHPQVSVPALISIPAGKQWVKFPITTPVVTSNITFTVTFTGPSNTVVSRVVTVTP